MFGGTGSRGVKLIRRLIGCTARPEAGALLLAMISLACATTSGRPAVDVEGPMASTKECELTDPLVLSAKEVLSPEMLSGPNFTVDEKVLNDGYINHYVVHSDFGDFPARGEEMLVVRLKEVRAIAILREMEKSEAWRKGMVRGGKEVLMAPVDHVEKVFHNPLYAVAGVQRELLSYYGMGAEFMKLMQSGFSMSYVLDMIGFLGAKRDLAHMLDVDTESRNEVLQKDLDRMAWMFYAGGAPLQIVDEFLLPAIPWPMVRLNKERGNVGEAFDIVHEEISPKSTRKRLRQMGFSRRDRKRFMDHDFYTSRRRRELVEAIHSLRRVQGRVDFIRLAMEASCEDEAYSYMRLAQMLEGYNKHIGKVDRLAIVNDAVVFAIADRTVVLPLYADYLVWTDDFATLAAELPEPFPHEMFTTTKEVWVSGKVSPEANSELGYMDFKVNSRAFDTLDSLREKAEREQADAYLRAATTWPDRRKGAYRRRLE